MERTCTLIQTNVVLINRVIYGGEKGQEVRTYCSIDNFGVNVLLKGAGSLVVENVSRQKVRVPRLKINQMSQQFNR